MASSRLTHLDEAGKASMVDVSAKPAVRRTAKAACEIVLAPATVELIRGGGVPKGDVLATARIAGIMAAKRTADLIPLCHNIEIDHAGVSFEVLPDRIRVESTATCTDKTGIEMEALTAASVAALTIWDMCKAVDKSMRVEGLRLLEKTKESAAPALTGGVSAETGGESAPGLKPFAIVSLNISRAKGVRKDPVDEIDLEPGHGIAGDAHAGDWHRQVSLLADEDIESMRGKGVELDPGIFAENVTTRGIDLSALPVGAILFMGDAILEVTQIGKECHHGCAIFQTVGDCVMPRKGIFAKVIRGGRLTRESRCHYRI